MVPCALVSERTETTKSASQCGDEGDEISPSHVPADELDDRAVDTEELHGASGCPAELLVPPAEETGSELYAFAEASEGGTFAATETGLDFEVVPSADAPQDGVPAAQVSGVSWVPPPWVTVARGASTAVGDLTVDEVQNPGEPVFQVDPDIDLCNGLWPAVLNYSPSQQLETDSRPKKKRRLTKSQHVYGMSWAVPAGGVALVAVACVAAVLLITRQGDADSPEALVNKPTPGGAKGGKPTLPNASHIAVVTDQRTTMAIQTLPRITTASTTQKRQASTTKNTHAHGR
ncbi:hypothetical protein MTO96_009530 [Rhipicephalus appendiculatus]